MTSVKIRARFNINFILPPKEAFGDLSEGRGQIMGNNSDSDRQLNIRYGQVQGLFWLFSAVSFVFMTPILQERGFGNAEIGILFAVRYVTQILGQLILSSIADRCYGRVALKWFAAGMTVLSVVFTALFLLLPGIGILWVGLLFAGMGCTTFCISPMIDALAMQFIELGRKINYTVCRAIGSAAWAFACLGIGKMMDVFGADSLLIFQIGFEVLFLISILRLENANPAFARSIADKGRKEPPKAHSPWYLLTHFPRYVLFIIAIAFLYVSYAMCHNFQIDVIRKLGGDNTILGYAEFVLAISEVPVIFFFSRAHRRFGTEKILVAVMFFAMMKVAVQRFAPSLLVFVLAQLFEMLGFGMSYAAVVYFVIENIPAEDRVKAQGFVNVAAGIGSCAASLMSGAIYERFGLPTLLVCGVGAGILSILVMIISISCPKKSLRKGRELDTITENL